MGKVIACVNEKGGVAKTTTVKNVAAGFVSRGKKVLVVDLDPSFNLTKSLGMGNKGINGSICDILDRSIAYEDIPEGYGIHHQEEGIDIVTSSEKLREYENKLFLAPQREIVLRRYMETIREKYDYIFIDCLAVLGILVVNALFCADSLIIPLAPQFLSVEAMQNLYTNIAMIRRQNGTNVKPEVLGTVFTMVRTNTNNDKNVMKWVKDTYSQGANFFKVYIPSLVKYSESDLDGHSIYGYEPNSPAAMIYSELVNEIFERLGEDAEPKAGENVRRG